MDGQLSKREAAVAAALGNMVDRSAQVADSYIAGELSDFGQRAWALRARVVDLRQLDATFVVSVNMLDLLRKHGLDLGAGPGGMFVRGVEGQGDTLFGIVIRSDWGTDERHRSVMLELCDTGEHFRAETAPVDTSKVRGLDDGPSES